MSKEKTAISFQADATMLEMINAINQKLSYGSRSSVVKEGVRRMYRQEFPSYGGKPTPLPTSGSASQVNTVAKNRVVQKNAVANAETIERLANAENIASVLGGHVLGKSGDISNMVIQHKRCTGVDVQEVEVPVANLNFMEMENLSEQSKIILMELKFRDASFEGEIEPQQKYFKRLNDSMILGLQRGNITTKHLTPFMVALYIEHLNKIEVDTTALVAQLNEGGFIAT